MKLSQALLEHALELATAVSAPDVSLRRAISAAYYALFHRLTEDAAALIAPNVSEPVRARIQRWFDHGDMKMVCGRFSKSELGPPLNALIGVATSLDLRVVATTFVDLQVERHKADYDPAYEVEWEVAMGLVVKVSTAIELWEKISGSHEANIFLLSMLEMRRWERER